MFRRPRKSEVEDQRMRPAEFASDRIATNPPAAMPSATFAFASSVLKKSTYIGFAFSRMPMPAVTLKQRTTHSSQNCGVLTALVADTLLVVMSAWPFGATQPAGFQSAAGTR